MSKKYVCLEINTGDYRIQEFNNSIKLKESDFVGSFSECLDFKLERQRYFFRLLN